MKTEIKIGGKDVTLLSNALTPFVYTEIFHKDFMRVLMSFRTFDIKPANDYTDDELAFVLQRAGTFSEIAFIMAQQANGKTAAELVVLTRVDYLEWLTNFESNAFLEPDVILTILSAWQGQAEGGIASKN